MRFLIKLLSPLLLGLFRRYGPELSGIDRAQLERSRKRLVSSLVFLFLSLVMFAASLLTAIIDAAMQFEQRGGLELNAVMMTAIGLFAGAIVAAIVAKVQFPSLSDLRAVARRGPAGAPRESKKSGPPRRPEYAH